MSIPGFPPDGRIESLHFAHLLARFWAGGFSGSFRGRGPSVPAPAASKEILFERGRIAWAASDDPRESIRTYLLNRGILRQEQWRLAQEKAGSTPPRRTLLDLGFLTARELQDADRERVSGIVMSIFNWSEGEYATAPAPLPPGTPNLKIDPRDLVLEGIMSSGDRGRVLRELGSLDTVLVVRPDDLVRASLSLPVELVELMGRADGTRTVADICALSPLSDFMISAAFAALKILGLANPAEGSSAAPPAPPKPVALDPARTRISRPVAPPAAGASSLPLPLGDDLPQEESATTQIIPTPPRGTGMGSSPGDPGPPPEEDDSGTIPMEATPPGGTARAEPHRDDAGGEMPERHPPEAQPPEAQLPETQPTTATPPGGQPAMKDRRESPQEHPLDLEDREGETEISPGIPIPPRTPEPGSGEPLDQEEIESAVRMFGGTEESPVSPSGTAGEAEAPEGAEADHERSGGTSAGASGAAEGSVPGGDAAVEDAPTWIYEPSGVEPSPPRSRRWAAWGGIAAGIFAVGTVLTMIMGDGGGPPAPEPGASAKADGAQGPPRVEVPGASEEPRKAEGSAGAPEPPSAAPSPAPPPSPGIAAASSEAAPSLASGGGGSILDSASFRAARGALEAGKLDEAAGGFKASVGGKSGLYTVQLALACRRETVTRALRTIGGAQEFFILPREFNGRACYRLLWGAYPGKNAAERGRATVPRAFRQAKDKPFVAPI